MVALSNPPPDGGILDGTGVEVRAEVGQPLGVPPAETMPKFQTDVYKELINKFAWALGSTYRRSYSRLSAPARQLAISLAKEIVRGQGWPEHIRKP